MSWGRSRGLSPGLELVNAGTAEAQAPGSWSGRGLRRGQESGVGPASAAQPPLRGPWRPELQYLGAPDGHQMGPNRRGGREGKARLATEPWLSPRPESGLCFWLALEVLTASSAHTYVVVHAAKVCDPHAYPADTQTLANGDTGTQWLAHAIRAANLT